VKHQPGQDAGVLRRLAHVNDVERARRFFARDPAGG